MRNPLTLEAFAAWCETRPANEVYFYSDCEECAFAEYLSWVGLARPIVGTRDYCDGPRGTYHPLPDGIDAAVRAEPWTYGDLSARLRANA